MAEYIEKMEKLMKEQMKPGWRVLVDAFYPVDKKEQGPYWMNWGDVPKNLREGTNCVGKGHVPFDKWVSWMRNQEAYAYCSNEFWSGYGGCGVDGCPTCGGDAKAKPEEMH